MNSIDRPTVRVRTTTDLLALIPALLGFHPTASLVLVAVDAAGHLPTVVRLDLAAATDPAGPLRIAVDQITTALGTQPGAHVVLAGYGSADQVAPAITTAAHALRYHGITIGAALRVANGRFWQLGGDHVPPGPAEGLPFDPATSPVTAITAQAGLAALPDREALAATLAPVTGEARDRMVAATAAACGFFADLMEAAAPEGATDPDAGLHTPIGLAMQYTARTYLRRAEDSYRQGQPVDDEQAGMLTAALELPSLRGYAVGRTSGQPWQIAMWTDLLRRAEPEFATTPAILLALCALHAGNGALADIAAHRALAADPDDEFAQWLATAIAAGITPNQVAALLSADHHPIR